MVKISHEIYWRGICIETGEFHGFSNDEKNIILYGRRFGILFREKSQGAGLQL